MKNKMPDLRNHLFEVIEMLKTGDERMDIHKAKVINESAQVLINSAKAETEFLEKVGGASTGFIENQATGLKQVK